ncbi:MAG: hypothetical protein HC828_05610 [Blastochloris sp.]|nr:hypothetical protein [Blastochloris sp.]
MQVMRARTRLRVQTTDWRRLAAILLALIALGHRGGIRGTAHRHPAGCRRGHGVTHRRRYPVRSAPHGPGSGDRAHQRTRRGHGDRCAGCGDPDHAGGTGTRRGPRSSCGRGPTWTPRRRTARGPRRQR